MKILLHILEKLRPIFENEGKLSSLKPVYEAMENFFFAPSSKTRLAPFSRDPLDIKRYMTMVIIALLPCVVASIYFFGLRVIPIIIVSYLAGGLVEVAFAIIRKENISIMIIIYTQVHTNAALTTTIKSNFSVLNHNTFSFG